MSEKNMTLRLPGHLHKEWRKESKHQRMSMNTYIISCVQRDRLARRSATDAIDIERFVMELGALRKDITSMAGSFDEILRQTADRMYASVELVRAKDALLSILLDEANISEVKRILSREDLSGFIARRNPLLEKYMIPTPKQPMTLLDEILFELEAERLINIDAKGRITWGVKLWENAGNMMTRLSQNQ